MFGDAVHADRVVRAGENHASHALSARAFVHFDERAQVVVDDLGQRALHARTCKVDQHIDTVQQTVYDGRVA